MSRTLDTADLDPATTIAEAIQIFGAPARVVEDPDGLTVVDVTRVPGAKPLAVLREAQAWLEDNGWYLVGFEPGPRVIRTMWNDMPGIRPICIGRDR